MKDYHFILGVRRNATARELRSAHRRRAKQTHPDTSGSSETAAFLDVKEAYDALSRNPPHAVRRSSPSPPGPTRPDPSRGAATAAPAALEIVLDPDEAAQGGRLDLVLPFLRLCPRCLGQRGTWPWLCPVC